VATNFSALRVKRNLLRRSNIGMMATRRGPAIAGNALPTRQPSYSLGVDATMLFLTSINVAGYYANTDTPGAGAANRTGTSYRGRFDFTTDRYGAAAEHMLIGPTFQPEVGFVRRTDVRRSFGQLRFSPRPKRSALVRKVTTQASVDYVTDAAAIELQSREVTGLFRIEFQSSDQLSVEHSREYELLPALFRIAPEVVVPAGEYTYFTNRVSYSLGQQRPLSGRLTAATGTLYDGTRSDAGFSGRWGVTPRLSVEPGIALNWVRLPYGDFNARLVSTRVTVTPSSRMLISSLVQWNIDASTLTSSVRLRWEYTGGSELFVVYSDGRDTRPSAASSLQNQTLAVKMTRLFRF
jgi:hypothetical protein